MIKDLAEAERQIREVIQEADLGWILTGADEAIAAGVPEQIGIIERSNRRSHDPEDELFSLPEVIELRPDSRQRPTRVVTRSRPMNGQERIELLLTALHRYLIDVPAVHDGLVQEINASADLRREDQVVQTIRFEPDSDLGEALHVQVAGELQPDPERTALQTRAEQVLQELQEEVGL
jgi:hypothetical protein